MTIASVDLKNDLSNLVDEFGKQLKDAKCEVEGLKGELVEANLKIKFLELEIIQAIVKVEHISTKKLDNVLSSQKSSHDKTGLGYTGEGSL